jgi:hypothetical protein
MATNDALSDRTSITRMEPESRRRGGSICYSRQFLFRAGVTFLFGFRFGTVAVFVAEEHKIGGMPLLLEAFLGNTTLLFDLAQIVAGFPVEPSGLSVNLALIKQKCRNLLISFNICLGCFAVE